ncbi:MAG: hypothetical protein CSA62_15030 [Planctomycetota bacterium]|nr:MAG: hypothetical protein CSA62_15030 [Planctomycetota bacterium]
MQQAPLPERFRVQAELAEIRVVRARLSEWLLRLGVSERTQEELTLVLDEAATNIARHAYPRSRYPEGPGPIDIELSSTSYELVLRLWDDGIERCEEDCVGRPLGQPGESGMGMNLIRMLTSSVRFERTLNGRNLLELRKELGGAAPESS